MSQHPSRMSPDELAAERAKIVREYDRLLGQADAQLPTYQRQCALLDRDRALQAEQQLRRAHNVPALSDVEGERL